MSIGPISEKPILIGNLIKGSTVKYIEIDKSEPNKVSTVFLEYVEPYLDLVFSELNNPSLEELNDILRVPWTIWNAFYLQQNGSDIDFNGRMFSLIEDAPQEMKAIFEFMSMRRKKTFAEYDYMIGEFSFYVHEQTGKLTFKAEARKNNLNGT